MIHRQLSKPLVGAIVGCVALLASGCSSSGPTAVSKTPRVTVDQAGSTGSTTLLTEDMVRDIQGLGHVTAQDINDASVFENPDTRGPCGGVVPQAPTDGAIGRAFVGHSVQVLEFVVPAGVEQRKFLEAVQADRRDPCESYESLTNRGVTQVVGDTTFVTLEDLGVPALAWTSTIRQGGGAAFVGAVLVDAGDQLIFTQILSGSPVRSPTITGLARASIAAVKG